MHKGEDLMDPGQLPQIQGRYGFYRSLASSTWFQVGGKADLTVKPLDLEDLVYFLENKPTHLPVLCLGVGSNILVRSGGIRGAVVRLGRGFSYVRSMGEGKICVGGGTLDRQVALEAQSLGLGGFSFLAGIPGTMGGAVFMNAGCYGCEIKDRLVMATVVDHKGEIKYLSKEDLAFSYRSSSLPGNHVVAEVILQGHAQEPEVIQKEMDEIMKARLDTQPVKSRTGGSTFANPEGHRAWELIDQAGCRGLRIGGALVSPMHCNFLINTGEATADDLENLMDEVENRVLKASGIRLRREIKCLGERLSCAQPGILT